MNKFPIDMVSGLYCEGNGEWKTCDLHRVASYNTIDKAIYADLNFPDEIDNEKLIFFGKNTDKVMKKLGDIIKHRVNALVLVDGESPDIDVSVECEHLPDSYVRCKITFPNDMCNGSYFENAVTALSQARDRSLQGEIFWENIIDDAMKGASTTKL